MLLRYVYSLNKTRSFSVLKKPIFRTFGYRVCTFFSTEQTTILNMKFEYPVARRDETVVDDYHGTKITDPYRWLEDPASEETSKYIKAQNEITFPYLEQCPVRDQIKKRLTELWDYPKFNCPMRAGDRYFLFKNSGLQNQNILYMRDSPESEEETVFLDPNTLSEDGTISLQDIAFSEDGSLLAYALSESGSDWITIHFMDIPTGKKYDEVLEKVKFSSIKWTHDNKGIFYSYYPHACQTDGAETSSNLHQKLYYHRVGTSQEEDVLIAEYEEEPRYRISATVSDCGRYLFLMPQKGCQYNLIYYCDLEQNGEIVGKVQLTPIVTVMEADYEYVTNEGSFCIFRTNKDAPNHKLVGLDLNKFDPDKGPNWTTVVPEHPTDVLIWTAPVNQKFLAMCYIHDVKNELHIHKITGEHVCRIPLDIGTIVGFFGRKHYHEIFYKFTSFLTPGTIYSCDLSQQEFVPKVIMENKVPNFDPSFYITKQIFYTSKDGTKIPMFIIHPKDLKLDGNAPCHLWGYGGFNVSIQPGFAVTRILFMRDLKGIVAIPNIRGGGEYGLKWHDAGRYLNKQNVFDDFQSAAEYLIAEKYTQSKLLTIQGGSNGGLLIAACINQRPDLFGCAIIQVGVLDMLRFHKFTIGYAWTSDYGVSTEKEYFDYLLKYSPLHNVNVPSENGPAQYPATLLLTADHDDRVVPLHSLKLIAELHHKISQSKIQENPVLIRIESKAGHGSGKPTSKCIDEATDIMCFIVRSLGLKYYY